jgi:hypothetical protein
MIVSKKMILVLMVASIGYSEKTKMVAGTRVEWKEHGYNPQTGMSSNYKIKKKYSICPVSEDCTPSTDAGFWGGNLIRDVQNSEKALLEAKKYQSITIASTGFLVGIPTFGVLAIVSGISNTGKNNQGFSTDGAFKPLVGLAIASWLGSWVTSFMESNQIHKVAEAYNDENVSLQYNIGTKGFVFGYKMRI